MKHTVHKSNSSDDDNPGCVASLFALIFVIGLSTIFMTAINDGIQSFDDYKYKSAEQLQTILKNECGMEYSIDEIRKNSDNLSLICGLKNETN